MVEIGSIIRAQVERIEPYGLFLRCGKETVVVLVPEVSWVDNRELHERVKVGDHFDVQVIRYNYEKKQVVGSIRRLHPEENPYRRLSRLEPGTIVRGRVSAVSDEDATIELPHGTRGQIPKHRRKTDLRVG